MRYLLRPLTLWVRYFPQLAACYLLGFLGRRGAIELAAWAGWDNKWWASVIMPLAGLARLASFIGMFLVLRPAFPVLAGFSPRRLRDVDVFSTIVLPFFAIYMAWQMFREDWLAFEARALMYRVDDSAVNPDPTVLDPSSIPVGTNTLALIGAALLLRYLLSWMKDRLPKWMVAVRVYVDTLWVFLALSFSVNQGLTLLLNPAGWISERRIVVWFSKTREELFSHFQPLDTAWDTLMWALRTVFGGAAVPLIWLAVAGVVYGVASTVNWRDTVRRIGGGRAWSVFDRAAPAQKRLNTRWSMVPKSLRDKAREHATGQLGKFRPIVDSLRLILHGGILALSLYVLAYLGLAWLDMAGSFYRAQMGDGYLVRGLAWLAGPQPWPFWNNYLGTVSLASHLIIEPLRICLVASTYVYCVERVAQATTASNEPESVPSNP
ncbi:hypothetical protein BVC93_25250 [Mycobacterium sp. MS1601]|uniref:hypothetical protein n=1 Tax=Mycobacterium sp. MS1601 TaxID=1936029 RepID=UPI0009795B80|nr:hypothetical protein [Mycobacterium sp. MS1601]AQA05163.1 hypothetical protein BVC93_25250 [Mycobacterium sp. MS1601]